MFGRGVDLHLFAFLLFVVVNLFFWLLVFTSGRWGSGGGGSPQVRSDDYLSSHDSLTARFCIHSYVLNEHLPMLACGASLRATAFRFVIKLRLQSIEFDSLHTALDVFTYLFPALECGQA